MSETTEAYEFGRCWRCGHFSGPEALCVRCDAAQYAEDVVGVRLVYVVGEMDARCCYFCARCWEDRPPDFDEAGCEPLSREEAQGQVCDICERDLTGAVE